MTRIKSRKTLRTVDTARAVEEQDEEEQQAKETGKRAGEAKIAPPAKKRATAAQRLADEAASFVQNTVREGFEEPVRRSSRNEKQVEGAAGGAADTPGDKFKMYTDESLRAQWTAMEMLLTNQDRGWIFEMDVEGRGDCWGFASIAGEQPSSLHTTAARS